MGIRTKMALTAALCLAVAGVVAPPASALPYELQITNVRTGSSPIVSGSSTGTTFKVSVSNVSAYEVGAVVFGKLDSGPAMTAVSSAGADCSLLNQSTFHCVTGPPTRPTRGPATTGIPAGGTIEVDVTVQALPTTLPGTYTLCSSTEALVGAPSNGPGCPPLPPDGPSAPVAPEATATVDVVMEADLGVTATNAPQTDPGARAQTKFKVTNGGPSLPPRIFLRGTLPAGLTFASAEGGGWSCSTSGQDVTCEYITDGCWAPRLCGPQAGIGNFHAIPAITWNLDTAKPGRVSEYKVPVTVSGQDTTNTGNGQATAEVPVTPVKYDLVKIAGGPYKVDDNVDWTLRVSNTGTIDDAGKITVTDDLPSSMRFVSATGEGWTCSHSGQKVTCTHPGLAKGASSDITLTTKVVAGGSLENTAKLTTESAAAAASVASAADSVRVRKLAQKAKPLPKTLGPIPAGTTNQGRKIRTKVLCRPYQGSAAGETRNCLVTRKPGRVEVKVLGDRKMVVLVTQSAPETKRYRRFFQKRIYVVNP